MNSVLFLRIAAISGGLAVVLGAFGAHGLRSRVAPDLLEVWETAVRYHFYHTLALLAVALVPALWAARWTGFAAIAWTVGMLIFSGSLYVLVLTGIRQLGAVTPIGGVFLVLGWLFLALAAGGVSK